MKTLQKFLIGASLFALLLTPLACGVGSDPEIDSESIEAFGDFFGGGGNDFIPDGINPDAGDNGSDSIDDDSAGLGDDSPGLDDAGGSDGTIVVSIDGGDDQFFDDDNISIDPESGDIIFTSDDGNTVIIFPGDDGTGDDGTGDDGTGGDGTGGDGTDASGGGTDTAGLGDEPCIPDIDGNCDGITVCKESWLCTDPSQEGVPGEDPDQNIGVEFQTFSNTQFLGIIRPTELIDDGYECEMVYACFVGNT